MSLSPSFSAPIVPTCEVCARLIEPNVSNPVAYPDDLRYSHLAFHSMCLLKNDPDSISDPNDRWGRILLWPKFLTEHQKREVIELQKRLTRLHVRPGTDVRMWENDYAEEMLLKIEDKVYKILFSQGAEERFLDRVARRHRQAQEAEGNVMAIHLPVGDAIEAEENLENDEEDDDEQVVPDPIEQFEDLNGLLSAKVEQLEGPTYEPGADSYQRSLQTNLPPIYRLLARALDLMEQRQGMTQQLAKFFTRRDYDDNNWLYGLIRRRILMRQFACPFPGPDDGSASPICQFPLTGVCPFYHQISRHQDQDPIDEDIRKPVFPNYICLPSALFQGFEKKECHNFYFRQASVLRCVDGYHCSKVKDLERFDLFTGNIFRQLTHTLDNYPALNPVSCVHCGSSGDSRHDMRDGFLRTVWVHPQGCLHPSHATCFLQHAQRFWRLNRPVPCPDLQCDLWTDHYIAWPFASFQSQEEKDQLFDWITKLWRVCLTGYSLRIEEIETEPALVNTGPRPSPKLFRLTSIFMFRNSPSITLDYTQVMPQYIPMFTRQ